MAGTTQYKNNWMKENLDRISLAVPKGQKEQIKNHASAQGESLNGFINRAICEAIDRDQIFRQNREEIISLAKENQVDTDIDIDGPEFKKVSEALTILEPHSPNLKKDFFRQLYHKFHPSTVWFSPREKDI